MSSKEQILLDRIIGLVNRTAPDAELYLYGPGQERMRKKYLIGICWYCLFENIQREGIRIKWKEQRFKTNHP